MSQEKSLQDTTEITEPSTLPGPRSAPRRNSAGAATATELKRLQTSIRYWVVGSLVTGMVLGALFMRYHRDSSDTIVAVNGVQITRDQLFDAMQQTYGLPVMHKLVTDQLELEFAAKKGLVPTDAEVDAKFAELKSEPNYDLILRNSSMSESTFKHHLKLQMAEDALFSQNVTVTDSDVQQFYAAQSNPNNTHDLFYRQPVTTLQALAVRTQDAAANAISAVTSGTPFDMVAQRVSLDASRVNGGRLNPLIFGASPLSKYADVERAVFALRVGQMSSPIFFNHGWWVFKCNDYTPASRIPFGEVESEARDQTMVAKGFMQNGQQIKEDFAAFARSSNLQAFWPQYSPALVQR